MKHVENLVLSCRVPACQKSDFWSSDISIVIKLVTNNKNKSQVHIAIKCMDKQFCAAKVKLLAWEYLKVFPLQIIITPTMIGITLGKDDECMHALYY